MNIANKAYPIPNTSIYWNVEHICKLNDILVRAAQVHESAKCVPLEL